MAKRIFIIMLMTIFIIPVYSKKDYLLKRCCCSISVGAEKEITGGAAIAKACKNDARSAAGSDISFSTPIGQYLTSFE